MRASGCDSVLVLRRTSTIHFESEDSATSSLHSFLTHRARLLSPKDQLEAGSSAPIEMANVYDNADWEIAKGEAIVFDLASGAILWRGDTSIKTAKDLPQARYYKFVAEKVAHALAGAGLIPPVKK
jgi:hypothetical protein